MDGAMQVEVGRYMSRSLISVVHIFEGCNDNFLDSLSILLHEVWAASTTLTMGVDQTLFACTPLLYPAGHNT